MKYFIFVATLLSTVECNANNNNNNRNSEPIINRFLHHMSQYQQATSQLEEIFNTPLKDISTNAFENCIQRPSAKCLTALIKTSQQEKSKCE